jgi:ketosteroid isomerase-like protein
MSENIDLVRSIYADWERGDYSAVEWAYPDIEYVSVDGPEPGTWVGVRGLAQGWIGWMSVWEDFRVEAEEFRELDEDRVLVLDRSSGRGRTSGLDVERARGTVLFHIHDGKVTRMLAWWDRDRALADLGLEQ